MSPILVAVVIGGYFLLLILISWITSSSSDAASFYTGNRASPWYLVAFGMIGASLSGVTFISMPGEVGNSHFHYFQMVLGYLAGYAVIALILMPLYYRHNLISIYEYLKSRFGFWSHKMGALFFLISRVIGASFRLFLVAGVLQIGFFGAFNLPFWVSVLATILLIWIYTLKGGIKTIVWTDTLQTTFMILSVIVSIILIMNSLNWNLSEMLVSIQNDSRSQVFNWNWRSPNNFFKQFIAGAFIAIVMTGLDQDMMQKNLTCKTLKDAQKNVFWFSVILIFVNIMFLCLGLLLYQFAELSTIGIPDRSDELFPFLAIQHMTLLGGVVFLLGITAAAYSSADSALTALTTSFCVDFLGFTPENFESKKKVRIAIHFAFSILLFVTVLAFQGIDDQSVITSVFLAAGYTYGPILGLFAFGIYTSWNVRDNRVPMVCLSSPIVAYIIKINAPRWFWGYEMGFEVLLVNGLITFLGLWTIRKNHSLTGLAP